MLRHRLRQILSLALLLSLGLPAMVTAAIAIHEAAHHRHDTHHGDVLFAVVHGHHHDREIEEHDHEAVVPKIRAGSTVETPAVPATSGESGDDAPSRVESSEGPGPPLDPPGAADLCIWRL